MATNLDQKSVPNPPFISPLMDENGFMSRPWSIWIRQAFARIGGNTASSITDLESSVQDVTVIQTEITALQSSVTALQASSFGLGVGPSL